MDYRNQSYAKTFQFDAMQCDRILSLLKPRIEHKILEVGCNQGKLCATLQGKGLDVAGIDTNAKAIEQSTVDQVQTMDATRLSFCDNTFDRIYSVHTIEHIPQISKAFKEMSRVLKPGGRVVLIYPAELVRGMFVALRATWYHKNPLYARKIHVHSLKPQRIEELASALDLRVTHHEFHWWPPQYASVLEKD